MSSTIIFFTDRLKTDNDPHSHWLWREFDERARSGSEVVVYPLVSAPAESFSDLHPRIQIRSGLSQTSLLNFRPFLQSLLNTSAESLVFVEPALEHSRAWPLVLAAQLKQIGLLKAQLNTLIFSAENKKHLSMSGWIKLSDRIWFTHPRFESMNLKIQSEKVHIDPLHFHQLVHSEIHWSLQDLNQKSIIPGGLGDLIDSELFLKTAMNILARTPSHQFVFLRGIGNTSKKMRHHFLSGPLAAHLLFPENLSGALIGHTLFMAQNIMLDQVHSQSPLAGLSLQIILERNQAQIAESRVYGLL